MLDNKNYRIYNIPGLIEGDKERITLNKLEISRAFDEQKQHSLVVIYVFGHQNGRIRNEDIVTFRAIHNAYTLNPDSLIIIVNGLPPDRPNNYNKDTQATLIDLLGMKPSHICFIDRLTSSDINQNLRMYLTDTILNVHPRIHIKTNDIHLMTDDVLQLQANLDMIQIQMYNEQIEHEDVITGMDREIEAAQRLSILRRLFCQVKVDLRRLVNFDEQEKHLMNIIKQWETEEIHYKNDSISDHYIIAMSNRQNAEEQLRKNFSSKHQVNISLNVHRKDIEQICFEFEQIYNGLFDRQHEFVREYYILFDDLRFDPSIQQVKHNFINDLYAFTLERFHDID